MKLAIIPARGGSKRIPQKNIKSFRGKPMIGWSILAAKESECFDSIIVSTDNEKIAEIALNWGAEVPFLRPAELADDHTPTIPVLRHAVYEYEKLKVIKVTCGCCIYATAPFVSSESLRKGMNQLETNTHLDFSFSVTTFPHPIQRALKLNSLGLVEMLNPEYELTRSQDLVECYHDAGQFYWFRPDSLKSKNGFFTANSMPIIIPRELAQDIDTVEDWNCAELLHRILEERTIK